MFRNLAQDKITSSRAAVLNLSRPQGRITGSCQRLGSLSLREVTLAVMPATLLHR
jgi:hypothetical protein